MADEQNNSRLVWKPGQFTVTSTKLRESTIHLARRQKMRPEHITVIKASPPGQKEKKQ